MAHLNYEKFNRRKLQDNSVTVLRETHLLENKITTKKQGKKRQVHIKIFQNLKIIQNLR